jgi:DNA polymerase-3 subunit alpha
MYIIFDTETTGLPRNWNAPITDTDNWPRVIQMAWQLHDDMGRLIEHRDFLIKPEGFDIPYDAEQIHGISTELALEQGIDLVDGLNEFNEALAKAEFVVGQNIKFDLNVWGCEFHRMGIQTTMNDSAVLDTCTEVTAKLCQIPGGRGGRFKLPTLTELHDYLFQQPFAEAHNATADVEATTRCFFELMRRGVFLPEQLQQEERYISDFQAFNPAPIGTIGLKHLNLKEESKKIREQLPVEESAIPTVDKSEAQERLEACSFAHLHNHSQFTILQSTSQVNSLVQKAVEYGMRAVALTDTGNMMAAFHFEKAISGHNKGVRARREEAEENGEAFDEKELIPIIGCEFNVCQDLTNKSQKDNGYQVV